MTANENMRRQIQWANRKLDVIELRSTAAKYLSDYTVCACQLNQHTSTFDSAATAPDLAITQIRSSCDPSASTIMAQASHIVGSSGNLWVDTIKLQGIQGTGIADRFRAKLRVEFKDDGTSFPVRGFEYEIRFRTDPASATGAKKVVSCDFVGSSSTGSGSGGLTGSCPAGQYMNGVDNGVIQCSGVAVAGAVSNGGGGTYSIGSPGPGCTGDNCVTGDFGACAGTNCVSNGNVCNGTNCSACGPTPSCTGTNCNTMRATECPRYGFTI